MRACGEKGLGTSARAARLSLMVQQQPIVSLKPLLKGLRSDTGGGAAHGFANILVYPKCSATWLATSMVRQP